MREKASLVCGGYSSGGYSGKNYGEAKIFIESTYRKQDENCCSSASSNKHVMTTLSAKRESKRHMSVLTAIAITVKIQRRSRASQSWKHVRT